MDTEAAAAAATAAAAEAKPPPKKKVKKHDVPFALLTPVSHTTQVRLSHFRQGPLGRARPEEHVTCETLHQKMHCPPTLSFFYVL